MNKNTDASAMKKMSTGRGLSAGSVLNATGSARKRVRLEIYGEEVIQKGVRPSGNSGRVYLPLTWIGHNVKIIRID